MDFLCFCYAFRRPMVLRYGLLAVPRSQAMGGWVVQGLGPSIEPTVLGPRPRCVLDPGVLSQERCELMYEGQLLSAFISEEVPLGTLVTSHQLVLKTHHTIETILFLSSFQLHLKPTRKRTKRLACRTTKIFRSLPCFFEKCIFFLCSRGNLVKIHHKFG